MKSTSDEIALLPPPPPLASLKREEQVALDAWWRDVKLVLDRAFRLRVASVSETDEERIRDQIIAELDGRIPPGLIQEHEGQTNTENPTGAVDANYVHVQSTPSTEWVINHNLGKYASVTVVNSVKQTVLGTVQHMNSNTLITRFEFPFSGEAYVN